MLSTYGLTKAGIPTLTAVGFKILRAIDLPLDLTQFEFYANMANLVGDRLYNEVPYATDYITVSGSLGSYTFQCPDTQAYEDADEDHLWFNCGTRQTVTEAQLVGSDFTRTFVNFTYFSPFWIRTIAIAKAGEVFSSGEIDLNFKNYKLHPYWNDSYNDNGEFKENRGFERIPFVPAECPGLELEDLDGNIYHTIDIGTQRWIVENLSVTKYADGSSIPNIELADGQVNKLTGWTNHVTYPFTTLTTSGKDILSAIHPGGSYARCFSNEMFVNGGWPAFGTFYFVFRLNVRSGAVPAVQYYKNGVVQGQYTFSHNTNPDIHTVGVLVTTPDTYGFGFVNENIGDSLDFEVEVIAMYSTLDIGWIQDTDGAYCWYNNDILNKPIYGALYNWHAIDNAKGLVNFTNNGNPITGYRIPSVADWTKLSTYLGGSSIAGGKLKEIGTDHWDSPNEGASNETGFTAVGSGSRALDGSFNFLKTVCALWTSTEIDASNATDMYLRSSHANIGNANNLKINGYSIRCVKDI